MPFCDEAEGVVGRAQSNKPKLADVDGHLKVSVKRQYNNCSLHSIDSKTSVQAMIWKTTARLSIPEKVIDEYDAVQYTVGAWQAVQWDYEVFVIPHGLDHVSTRLERPMWTLVRA